MKSIDELTKDWSEERKRKIEARADELKVELDAAADYFERTGKNYWYKNPVEQRKIIEAWRDKNDLHI